MMKNLKTIMAGCETCEAGRKFTYVKLIKIEGKDYEVYECALCGDQKHYQIKNG